MAAFAGRVELGGAPASRPLTIATVAAAATAAASATAAGEHSAALSCSRPFRKSLCSRSLSSLLLAAFSSLNGGSHECEYTPRLIKSLEDIKVKRIAAGMLHSACIDEKGTAFVFGERTTGKLGFGESKNMSIPIVVPDLPFCEDVACGGYHTCVVTDKGELYSWGSNENGCLGLGCTEIVRKPQIVESPLLKFPVSVISCGWKHTAVVSGRKVFSWGWGGANGTFFEDGHSSGGQLGHGNDVDYTEPMVLNLGENVAALHVSCGFNHSGGIFEYKEV